MKCNVGFLSDFEEFDPGYYGEEDWDDVKGVACPDVNECWVFVDQIAFFNEVDKSLELKLSLTVIHELIHLCGCLNEDMVYTGVKLVTWGEM